MFSSVVRCGIPRVFYIRKFYRLGAEIRVDVDVLFRMVILYNNSIFLFANAHMLAVINNLRNVPPWLPFVMQATLYASHSSATAGTSAAAARPKRGSG
jgi:hypothetical protein